MYYPGLAQRMRLTLSTRALRRANFHSLFYDVVDAGGERAGRVLLLVATAWDGKLLGDLLEAAFDAQEKKLLPTQDRFFRAAFERTYVLYAMHAQAISFKQENEAGFHTPFVLPYAGRIHLGETAFREARLARPQGQLSRPIQAFIDHEHTSGHGTETPRKHYVATVFSPAPTETLASFLASDGAPHRATSNTRVVGETKRIVFQLMHAVYGLHRWGAYNLGYILDPSLIYTSDEPQTVKLVYGITEDAPRGLDLE